MEALQPNYNIRFVACVIKSIVQYLLIYYSAVIIIHKRVDIRRTTSQYYLIYLIFAMLLISMACVTKKIIKGIRAHIECHFFIEQKKIM